MWEEDFNQFMQLRIQPVIAAEKFAREENMSRVLIATLSQDMDEQLKVAHKVVDDQTERFFDFAVVQCGQAREFLCSNPIIGKKEGGWEVSANCLCEI